MGLIQVNDIYSVLCQIAPLELQLGFDNAGIQLGRQSAPVHRALLALDLTPAVVEEAIHSDVQLVITHHPLIFTPLKSICDEKLLRLIENQIAVISMHTNLDIVQGGVNDVLLHCLGATGEEGLDADGCGRIGVLPRPMTMSDFTLHCKEKLKAKGLRFYNAGRAVKKLAVMGGAGGDYVDLAYSRGCDTYVSADIKYNRFLEAAELGINLIDAGHFCTEEPIMPVLSQKLSQQFPDVSFILTQNHGQLIDFL